MNRWMYNDWQQHNMGVLFTETLQWLLPKDRAAVFLMEEISESFMQSCQQ